VDQAVWSSLSISLKVAAASTLLVALLGTWTGRHLARGSYRGKEIVSSITLLPLFLPPTVLGYYMTLLFGRRGPIGEAAGAIGIEFTFTWLGAALASAAVAFPLMVQAARSAFEHIDRDLEDAAALDGAGRLRILLHIALPLARNGLLSGVALTFARAIGEFGATLMIAGNIPGRTQTMPLAIYDAFTLGDDALAFHLALLLTGVSLAVIVIGFHLGRSR
jgi:molybdate transport system permease protein